MIAYLISKFLFGIDPILETNFGGISDIKEFPALVATGVVAGFVSVIYMNGLTHPKFFLIQIILNLIFNPQLQH